MMVPIWVNVVSILLFNPTSSQYADDPVITMQCGYLWWNWNCLYQRVMSVCVVSELSEFGYNVEITVFLAIMELVFWQQIARWITERCKCLFRRLMHFQCLYHHHSKHRGRPRWLEECSIEEMKNEKIFCLLMKNEQFKRSSWKQQSAVTIEGHHIPSPSLCHSRWKIHILF